MGVEAEGVSGRDIGKIALDESGRWVHIVLNAIVGR